MHTMTQSSIKVRFASYLAKRGYQIQAGSVQSHDGGVSAQVRNKPDPQHFTNVADVNPKIWYVRISVKDYDNHQITGGLL